MIRIFIIALILFPIMHVSAQERSLQLWNQNKVDASLTRKTTLSVSEKIHYTPRNPRPDLKFADVFLMHNMKSWLEFGGGYRLAKINRIIDWLTEQRVMAVGNISNDSEILQLNFSNRLEYRIFNKAEDHFRHKQKLTLQFPVLTSWNLRFWIAEETFEKFTKDNLHLARLYGGLQIFELQYIQMNMYYILEKCKYADEWSTRDILGLNLGIDI